MTQHVCKLSSAIMSTQAGRKAHFNLIHNQVCADVKENWEGDKWIQIQLNTMNLCEVWIWQSNWCPFIHSAENEQNWLTDLCYFWYKKLSCCSKNTPQTEIKKERTMPSRTSSYLIVFRKCYIQHRENMRMTTGSMDP